MDRSYGFEQHVAQQSRRDKLRVSQHFTQEFPRNSELDHLRLGIDFVRSRSANKNAILPPDSSLLPCEMINFSVDSNVLSDQRGMMLRQELGSAQCNRQIMTVEDALSNSLLKGSGGIVVDGGYWKFSQPQQGCDWMVNYATDHLGGNMAPHSSMLNGFQNSNSFNNPSGETFNRDSHKRVGQLQLPPSHYQNTLQDVVTSASFATQDVEMTSIVQHNFREINPGVCEGSGSELALLPVYRDQSNNVLPFDNTGSWTDRSFDNGRSWAGELGSIARKRDEESRTFMSDSNPQGLSLSLSSNPPAKMHTTTQFEESEELHESMNNLHGFKTVKSEDLCRLPKPSIASKFCGKSIQDAAGAPSNTYRNTGPLGPFTGYATILKSSKFLKPAQLLLDEFCGSTGSKFLKPCEVSSSSGEIGALASSDVILNTHGKEIIVKENNSCADASTFYGSNETGCNRVGSISSEPPQPEYQQKKAKLLCMLEEVCRRYKQYHQQMQMVVSSFESVAGLSSATPYISFALKTVSRHFRCLKNTISDQLKYLRKVLGEDFSSHHSAGTSSSKGDASSAKLKYMEQSFQRQKSVIANMGFLESQHVWRPQRGLPERAVAILRAWLFEHFLHPYPTDTDKHMLATQTGLSRNQVSNWFINARVRVWKPMVEEIHMLETKGLAEMNKTHGMNDGGSTIDNTNWTNNDQPLKNHDMNTTSNQHLHCLGVDASNGNKNGMTDQPWEHDKQSKLDGHIQSNVDGELIGFMPFQSNGVDIGGLGAVSLTLGLRHRVENPHHQHQRRLQQHQDDQLLRQHYGSEMLHDFVG